MLTDYINQQQAAALEAQQQAARLAARRQHGPATWPHGPQQVAGGGTPPPPPPLPVVRWASKRLQGRCMVMLPNEFEYRVRRLCFIVPLSCQLDGGVFVVL